MTRGGAPVLAGILILTATWTHLSRTEAIDVRPTVDAGRWWPARDTLQVVVTEAGFRVWYADEPELVLAGADARARLGAVIGALRPHLASTQPVRVRAVDRVGYDRIVEALDVFLDQGLRQVAVEG